MVKGPGHQKPVVQKPVGRMFEICDWYLQGWPQYHFCLYTFRLQAASRPLLIPSSQKQLEANKYINLENLSTSDRKIGYPRNSKIPQHTKKRLPEIPFQIPTPETQKIQNSYSWGIFWYFRGIFSISCCRGNSDVRVVFWAYFGVWGVFLFCS